MTAALSLAGVVLAAALGYVAQASLERRKRIRDGQISATIDFCRSLMRSRGAQIDRWHTRGTVDPSVERAAHLLAHQTRAEAWADYFHVVLVVPTDAAKTAARKALDATTRLRHEPDGERLDLAGDEVRKLTEDFVHAVAESLHVSGASLRP